MIERKFVAEKTKEMRVMDWLKKELEDMGYSRAELEKTPLGMKVIIYSFKPGMVVGRGGSNIEKLSKKLESKFSLESPHIEVREIENPDMDPQIVANNIGKYLSIYGVTRFKSIGYRNLNRIMRAGATGAEIIISGRVPSSRSRTWRFYKGFVPKCGQTAKEEVKVGFRKEKMKMGIVGITVRILPPDVTMPDDVTIKQRKEKEEKKEEKKVPKKAKKETKPKKKEEKKEKPEKKKKAVKKKEEKKRPEKKKAPKKKEEKDYKSMTKGEIYEIAQKKDIDGRSTMNKSELIKAVKGEEK